MVRALVLGGLLCSPFFTASGQVSDRNEKLRELMAANPRAALRQVQPGIDQELSYTGPATISVLDDADRRNALVLYEFSVDGVRMSAYAAAEDAAMSTCGSIVQLRGWRSGDRAAISRAATLRDAGAPGPKTLKRHAAPPARSASPS